MVLLLCVQRLGTRREKKGASFHVERPASLTLLACILPSSQHGGDRFFNSHHAANGAISSLALVPSVIERYTNTQHLAHSNTFMSTSIFFCELYQRRKQKRSLHSHHLNSSNRKTPLRSNFWPNTGLYDALLHGERE